MKQRLKLQFLLVVKHSCDLSPEVRVFSVGEVDRSNKDLGCNLAL